MPMGDKLEAAGGWFLVKLVMSEEVVGRFHPIFFFHLSQVRTIGALLLPSMVRAQ